MLKDIFKIVKPIFRIWNTYINTLGSGTLWIRDPIWIPTHHLIFLFEKFVDEVSNEPLVHQADLFYIVLAHIAHRVYTQAFLDLKKNRRVRHQM